MNKSLFALAILLTSCASDMTTPQGTPAQVMGGASSTPAMAYPATPDVAALQGELFSANQKLIDAQSIVSAKQAEIDRMDRQRLEFTVTAEYGGLVIAGYTQSAYSAEQAGTQLAIISTMTAYPTAAELQRQAVALRNAELTAQAGEPDRIRNLTDAEQDAKWADEREVAAMCLKGVLFFVGIILIVRLIFGTLYKWTLIEQAQKAKVIDDNLKDIIPIPPAVNTNVINCTIDQLLYFADGVENQNKSLTFADWTGTPVSPVLKELRDFFEREQADGKVFAVEATRHSREFTITSDGHEFLQKTLVMKAPPSPYRCAEQTSEEKDE